MTWLFFGHLSQRVYIPRDPFGMHTIDLTRSMLLHPWMSLGTPTRAWRHSRHFLSLSVSFGILTTDKSLSRRTKGSNSCPRLIPSLHNLPEVLAPYATLKNYMAHYVIFPLSIPRVAPASHRSQTSQPNSRTMGTSGFTHPTHSLLTLSGGPQHSPRSAYSNSSHLVVLFLIWVFLWTPAPHGVSVSLLTNSGLVSNSHLTGKSQEGTLHGSKHWQSKSWLASLLRSTSATVPCLSTRTTKHHRCNG